MIILQTFAMRSTQLPHLPSRCPILELSKHPFRTMEPFEKKKSPYCLLVINFKFPFLSISVQLSLISPSTSPFALSPNPPLQTMSCASSSVPSIPSKLSRPSSRDPLYSTASASSSVMNIPGLWFGSRVNTLKLHNPAPWKTPPLSSLCSCLNLWSRTNHAAPFWAAAPKGRCPVGHRGEPLRTSVRPPPPEGFHASNSHWITWKIDKMQTSQWITWRNDKK